MIRRLTLALLVVITTSLTAQERLTLTTPVQVSPGATTFRLWELDLRRDHPDRPAGILAVYREIDAGGVFVLGGRNMECRYEGSTADALVIALNKANLTTTSLEKRVVIQCQSDKQIGPGTITGVVQ